MNKRKLNEMKDYNDWSYDFFTLLSRNTEWFHSEIPIGGSAPGNMYGDGWKRTKSHRMVARLQRAIIRPYYGSVRIETNTLAKMVVYLARVPSQVRFKYIHLFKSRK